MKYQEILTPTQEPSFEEFLRKAVEVLCKRRRAAFVYEKELRLCQFKIWLLEDDKDLSSITDGGMIFAAAAVSAKMRRLRAEQNACSPSEILEKALKHPTFRYLFDYGFHEPRTLFDLSNKLPFGLIYDAAVSSTIAVDSLNELTQWRLRIAKTAGLKTNLTKGVNAYQADLEEEAPEAKMGVNRGRTPKDFLLRSTKVKEVHRARVNRESFLYVADRYCPEILEFATRPGDVLTLLTRQAKRSELFRRYFGLCQTALSLLEVKSPSAATLGGWSGVPALPLDDVVEIPEADQGWLGVKDEEKRSAKETKRAKRQTPRT